MYVYKIKGFIFEKCKDFTRHKLHWCSSAKPCLKYRPEI